ncbi:DNA topoisomerase III beta-1 [Cryptosporidium ubiquitum]|uniref:DNA topoisomerase n=1 Tax=Cryptosporidium ubiquitum TaxID=857276 RepID=A0A1J4MI51_9CRYT|nr:DNA topoisomerase III beta-1 [Cryptosporidium ubiquitum]OII73131.1 DNA topoisomerase III beta-1 [Cryptosporidium ubiquitum]
MSPIKVLMVAEKPSISDTISKILSNGKLVTRRAKTPVHEFNGNFRGMNVQFKVTSVAGHVFETNFPQSYSNWEKTDPVSLFDAPIIKNESSSKMISHLEKESKGCSYLVLWLDCDREGENICFEIISVVSNNMNKGRDQKDWVFRAKFSSIAPSDISYAMKNLVSPNKNESDAVDVRQELDLKIGVAFSRLQTNYLKSKFGDFNKSSIISYGPCQTPTLFFTVQRRDSISSFIPEKYYTISVTLSKDSQDINLNWSRSRVFEIQVANCFLQLIQSKKPVVARVIDITSKNTRRIRPLPLNTVSMLKLASTVLGIGPFQTLNIAEKLYLSGFTTYPRTETSRYPKNFDIKSTIAMFKNNPIWGSYSSEMLQKGFNLPRKDGVDLGDHPPITPVRSATQSDLDGDSWRLYDLITRHFFATISSDIKIINKTIKFDLNGETFVLSGKQIIDHGFSVIQGRSACYESSVIPNFAQNELVSIKNIEIITKETKPPPILSESDLLSLMEKYGIGTDASMPTHIQKIQEREYVKLVAGRRLEPTKLGTALVHGIMNVDHELVMPMIRSEMEKYVDLIAKGKYNHKAVLKHSLSVFKLKFLYFAENISLFESLFQLGFTNISASCSRISRCGQCKRYMTYISNILPQRLYCSFCEIYLDIPQRGTIKIYKELKCPIDDYEILLFTDQKGKKSIFCPRCYNDPPFMDAKDNMFCKLCPHQTCNFSLKSTFFMACPNQECRDGIITLDLSSSPDWKFDCSRCSTSFSLKKSNSAKISLCEHCEKCGSRKLKVSTEKILSEYLLGCPNCDEQIFNLIEVINAPKVVYKSDRKKTSFRGGGKKGKIH